MKAILNFAIAWLITRYTDDALQRADIERIKRFIEAQESEAIAKAIKHERTAELVKSITHDLSNNLIDWIIRTILYLIRVTK
jgi:hypothetical protein